MSVGATYQCVADRLYSLKECAKGYQCPLCEHCALPYPLYTHFLLHLPAQVHVHHNQTSIKPHKIIYSYPMMMEILLRRMYMLPPLQKNASSHH